MAEARPGWNEAAQRFFIGLAHDNSRTYFEANRKVYETEVRAPMQALVDALAAEFGPAKIFRINRDVRFSADKSPYKTNIAAVIGEGAGGGYVELTARGLGAGAGHHHMDSAELAHYRSAVASASGERLETIVRSLEAAGYSVGNEALKTMPRGYDKEHPRAGLLRFRGMVMWRDFGLQPWLGTPEVVDRVAQVFRDSKPLQEWLGAHVPRSQYER